MIINTNISSMIGMNNLRQTGLGLTSALEKLSSGLKINKGADDPSGLAIAKGMEAQIGGIRVAVQNAEDGISLIHTADGSLAETQDILMRMRDLAVRAANQATLTSADVSRINQELTSLKAEINRKASSISFNKKTLFTGSFFGSTVGGQYLQIGPDNGAGHRLSIVIGTMTLSGLGLTPGGASFIISTNAVTGSWVSMAWSAIDLINSAINKISNSRAFLGIQERRLGHIIDDLNAEDINISAAKSRIMDADMASTISDFTRLQILQQSGTAILAQSNALPQSVLQLLQ